MNMKHKNISLLENKILFFLSKKDGNVSQ